MNNPCKECLVQVNCTAVCEDKENFQTLLENALKSYGVWRWVNRNRSNDPLIQRYRKWLAYKQENENDMTRIVERANRLKSSS